uniref:Coluporin-11 n=1 Tax=Colubraria reticulata TaxID=604273 RepID=A0A499RUG4_9CAEN|nr:coluporin-11 [Colubraria reticulata]
MKTLLAIFLLVIGFPGRSPGKVDLPTIDYRVKVKITVENHTPYTLTAAYWKIVEGVTVTDPLSIGPRAMRMCAFRKRDNVAYGTYGTVSWEVSGKDHRFVVMWSAPFSFDFYSNWMGLGLTERWKTSVAFGDDLFKEMYGDTKIQDFTYLNKDFFSDLNPVNLKLHGFNMTGTMTSGHHAEITVKFEVAQET